MRLRWPVLLISLAALCTCCAQSSRQKYDARPAPDFLFERRPFTFECDDRSPGHDPRAARGAYLRMGNEAPFLVTRSEEAALPRSDTPSLAITADPSQWISVAGSNRDNWSIRFCAQGEGNSESEARGWRDQVSMTRVGGTVSLNGPILAEKPQARGTFVLDAPADAPISIHASFAPVAIRDMTSPVRVTATHARATILDTTGQVGAVAGVVDFAGSRGRVDLSAEAEIDLKITSPRFEGTLSAWAQRSVRMLVPPGFATPFQASVDQPQDFICRASFCGNVKQERKNGLYVFTYGGVAPVPLQLRSELATVVIDTINAGSVLDCK
jgi:hypothetical protein